MRYSNFILSLSLGLSLIACSKDDDKDKDKDKVTASDAVGENGETAQAQVYTNNLDVTKPLLVVYGDSLSTGVLANTTLGKDPDPSLTLQLVEYVKQQEFNATGFQTNLSNPDVAAATTVDGYGLRATFAAERAVTAADVGVVSFAKFGGKARDLPHMLASWQQLEKSTIPKKPEFIYVMVGGNDFCSDFTVEEILKDVSEQTMAIHKNAPEAKIVIAPSPPIDQLASIDFVYGPALAGVTGEELSCRKFREKLCKRVYEDPTAVKARISAINTGIQDAANKLKADGANVVFVSGMLSWQIKPEELAVDCFHPSALGQQTIGNYVKDALKTPL